MTLSPEEFWQQWVEKAFPNLQGGTGYELKSGATIAYNCIAWAAGDSSRFWWPTARPAAAGTPALGGYYWPRFAPPTVELDSFRAAFEGFGYHDCPDGTLEPSFEKIAIYALGDKPTHAARQLEDGTWASKCGRGVDIHHDTPGAVDNNTYGQVSFFMRRSRIPGYIPPSPPPFP